MAVGAHPDDEWNGFMAWLGLGQGVRTVYACALRGEGGQNAVGVEQGADLGALRACEMELAAATIGMGVRWLNTDETDPLFDFGFARSAEDTLARWGAARLTGALVHAIRAERPDVVSPTFLDVPGQHGHHRAITRTLLRAVDLAADPAFPDALPPWRVAKAYLPAFSGAGGSYDDEEPPPPATVTVDLGEFVPELGLSWAQLGEQSRRFHASQGMGRDLPAGPRPLALHQLFGPPDHAAPTDNLPPCADPAIAEALAAWPDIPRVAAALRAARPDERNCRQVAHALAVAEGIEGIVTVSPDPLLPGTTAHLRVTAPAGATVTPRAPAGWTIRPEPGGFAVDIPADAPPFGTARPGFDPLGGNEPLGVTLSRDGAVREIDPAPVLLAPARPAFATPAQIVHRIGDPAPIRLRTEAGETTLPPPAGRADLPSRGDSARIFAHPHTGRVARIVPAPVALLGLDLANDAQARVGVVAAPDDATADWLTQLGIAAERLDDDALAAPLARFTCLLVGIAGFARRPALAAQRPRLMEWMRAGGHLVTLYHRPQDGWDNTWPAGLAIGTPSLRWRVSEPDAPVEVLAPDHPLLNRPNRITAADWQGWVRERGLYFARDWSPAYTPLLALADTGQPRLSGALLHAAIGAGAHTHVALALHRQYPALVPGAFRLLANLVSGSAPSPG